MKPICPFCHKEMPLVSLSGEYDIWECFGQEGSSAHAAQIIQEFNWWITVRQNDRLYSIGRFHNSTSFRIGTDFPLKDHIIDNIDLKDAPTKIYSLIKLLPFL